MGDDLLIVPVQVQAPTWRADDSATITLITSQAMSSEQFKVLSDWKKVICFMALKRNKFDPTDLPKENAPGTKWDSNRAKRLRQKLFIVHKKHGGLDIDFEAYYEHKMAEFEAKIDQAMGD